MALNHYGFSFDRRVISVFQDFEDMLAINPLGKAPALIHPEDGSFFDSRAIIEYLEAIAPPNRRLTPDDDIQRHDMLRIEAVGIGLAEKIYERAIEFSRRSPGTHDPVWIERLERQILSTLQWLESHACSSWLVGDQMTRADLAVTVAATYGAEKLPTLFDSARFSQLDSFRQRCEALPAFSAAAYSATEAAATGWQPEADD